MDASPIILDVRTKYSMHKRGKKKANKNYVMGKVGTQEGKEFRSMGALPSRKQILTPSSFAQIIINSKTTRYMRHGRHLRHGNSHLKNRN